MLGSFYLNENTVIVNYSKRYPKSEVDVLNSKFFYQSLLEYFEYVDANKLKIKEYLFRGRNAEDATRNFIHFLKKVFVFEIKEIDDIYVSDVNKALSVVENFYNFYRGKLRMGVVEVRRDGSATKNFIETDTEFNRLILSLYRRLEEKLQNYPNKIYRQLNAASDGCMLLRKIKWDYKGYEKLKKIGFIDSLVLRTPLIVRPSTNKREGSFDEVFENPIDRFDESYSDWICYPAKIGESLSFLYFHKDFIASGISLANLFELATVEEYQNKKPDLICLFGMDHEEKGCKFYYDKENDIYVGYVAYEKKIEYFGYLKKTALTLHNVSMLSKKKLPIHGSMVRVHFKNGNVKNVAFMGDSGAGKSETIEALRLVGKDVIDEMEVIFDDMGSFMVKEDGIYAQGTEIGAFVRLDDLEKGIAYRDMDRSIFMNPETANARVVIPVATYDLIVNKHKVDIFLYANNYDEKFGMHRFTDIETAKTTFVSGKRRALGTTHEQGMSETFFANPFGPMQKQEESNVLIDEVFDKFIETGTYLGEIYTRLGFDKSSEGLKTSAKELLEFLSEM